MIIDGIDVSGCGFIHEDTGTECHIALAFSEEYGECWHCEQIKNCYYKQLKRAEIFNKELCKKFNEDMTNLLQENEKLKKQYNCYACGNCKGKEDYKNLEKHHKGLRKQFDKYHQTLEEIREIGNLDCGNCQYNNGDCNCNYEECLEYKIEDILKKIDEVLNDRN